MPSFGRRARPPHLRMSKSRLPRLPPAPTVEVLPSGEVGMPGSLLVERHGLVALLTLNRPEKLNALNDELIGALMAALDGIELDRSVRAVVITGAGRAFSAGADIAEFQPHMQAGPAEAIAGFMRPGHRLTRRIEEFPKPVIGAINGLAF